MLIGVRVGVTRLPRKSVDDPIEEIQGPVLDMNCKHVCRECISYLEKKVLDLVIKHFISSILHFVTHSHML